MQRWHQHRLPTWLHATLSQQQLLRLYYYNTTMRGFSLQVLARCFTLLLDMASPLIPAFPPNKSLSSHDEPLISA